MRNDDQSMPEIIEVSERDGQYFGVVAVVFDGDAQAFEFGIDAEGYHALRKVLHHRPFGMTDPGAYRYYFVPGTHRFEPKTDRGEFSIRVERGPKGQQFRAVGPRVLIANLKWFADLKFPNGARHLRRVASRPAISVTAAPPSSPVPLEFAPDGRREPRVKSSEGRPDTHGQ